MNEASDVRLLYVTCRDANEARELTSALLERRLAACTNALSGMVSTYWWNNAIETAQETVLIVKTTSALATRARELIIEKHSYDVPCVLELPVVGGHAAYLNYLTQETRG